MIYLAHVKVTAIYRKKNQDDNASVNQRPKDDNVSANQRKTQTLVMGFPSNLLKFCLAVAEEKPKMVPPIRGQGDHFFRSVRKHVSGSVRFKYLLRTFRQIPFSGF